MRHVAHAIAIIATLASGVQPVAAAEQLPYFRMHANVAKPQESDLRFASGDALPSGTLGTPVRSYFQASGGAPPYAMTLVEAPAGVSMLKASDDTWTVGGALSPVGNFASALVRLTDSSGASATFPVPVTVTDGGTASDLGFSRADAIPSGVVGTDVATYYVASGGTAPYDMALEGAPSGLVLSQMDGHTFTVTGKLDPVGSYPRALVRLRDASGSPARTASVPLAVKAPRTSDALAFASGTLGGGAVGTPVNAAFKATGGTAPYSMALVGAPAGVTLARTSPDTFTATGTLTPAGSYPSASIRLTDGAGGAVTLGVPLTVTEAATASDLSFASSDPIPDGTLGTPVHAFFTASGGAPPYTMALVDGPAGVTMSRVTADTWTASGTLAPVGSFPNAKVRLTDGAGGAATSEVPVNVSPPQEALAFGYAQDLPPSFETFSTQSAAFGIRGGVKPYAFKLSAAPTTVVAARSDENGGSVVGVVEAPGNYTGVTLTVTDATNTVITRTLPPFTVTDNGGQTLSVTGLDPLPETMLAGSSFQVGNVVVNGSAGPNYNVYASMVGGPAGQYGPKFMQVSYQEDPVRIVGGVTVSAGDVGSYDVSVLFTDLNDPKRTKLVRWGTTKVVLPPFSAAGQFASPVTGTAGDRVTVYARVKGGSRNVSASITTPAGVTAQASYHDCHRYICYSYTYPAREDDEDFVGVDITLPAPGTYQGFRVVATDETTGERIYFDPFSVVASKAPPMVKVSEFDTPVTLQGTQNGTYMSPVFARVKGGSANPAATVNAPGLFNLGARVYDCAANEYYCNNSGIPLDEKMVELSGYSLPSAGTYENIVVTIDDPSSGSTVTFAPVTIVINPPPLAGCRFKDVSALSANDAPVPGAVTFVGGRAPYAITATGVDGLTYGVPTETRPSNYTSTATMRSGGQGGTAHVTVTDAAGDSCSGDITVKPYGYGAATSVAVLLDRSAYFGGYAQMSPYAGPESTNSDVYPNETWSQPGGPVGVHPNPAGLHFVFQPSNGAEVTGFSLASVEGPGGIVLLGPYPYPSYGYNPYPQPDTSLYMADLHGQGIHSIPKGDYSYRYYVFMADGTYGLSDKFTIHAP